MNRLEQALLDPTGSQLDLYLEVENTKVIMAHIDEIRIKAALSTEAGRLRERILEALKDENPERRNVAVGPSALNANITSASNTAVGSSTTCTGEVI